MMNYSVKMGFIPTRRDIFSKKDAQLYKNRIMEKLSELNVEFVDIEDINEEGLLFDPKDVVKVVDKMTAAKVDCLFFPHCNFGSEDLVAEVARKMKLPILLWGPRDEAPLSDGSRLRDSQCGLFATGKVLRRFDVKFTYLTMCRLEDRQFEEGIRRFIASSNVVKEFGSLKILQISTRPATFLTVMANEGELLERFNIRIHPISLSDLNKEIEVVKKDPERYESYVKYLGEHTILKVKPEAVIQTACMRVAMESLAEQYGCKAIAIQCWRALQDVTGIFPCVANSLLTDEGIPVVCETDIHGAISSIIAQAAAMGKATFFADWTVPHPENENGELLQHCGPWPLSLLEDKATFGAPFAFDHSHPGSLHGKLRNGKMSLLRFDGDHGKYSVLLGSAKSIDGPFNQGTYGWIEVKNLKKLEHKLVTGPYIHHCVGVFDDILPVVAEAFKYIGGVEMDYYDDIEELVEAKLRGEDVAYFD